MHFRIYNLKHTHAHKKKSSNLLFSGRKGMKCDVIKQLHFKNDTIRKVQILDGLGVVYGNVRKWEDGGRSLMLYVVYGYVLNYTNEAYFLALDYIIRTR